MALINIIDKLFNQRKPVEVEGNVKGDVALEGKVMAGGDVEVDGKVITNSIEDLGIYKDVQEKNKIDTLYMKDNVKTGIYPIVLNATDFEKIGSWSEVSSMAPWYSSVAVNARISYVHNVAGSNYTLVYYDGEKLYSCDIREAGNNLLFEGGDIQVGYENFVIIGETRKVFTPFFTEEQYEALLALLENN